MHDEWIGFAKLLTDIIERHASELDFDDMPLPRKEENEELHIEKSENAA